MKILLALLAALLAFGITSADYSWLNESLEPVSHCQGVVGSITHEVVYINLYCPEHDENGGMIQVQKSVFIDLILKDVDVIDDEWFELLD